MKLLPYLLCLTISGYTQSAFHISGRLIGKDTGTIVLWYTDAANQGHGDTTKLDHGRFSFSGNTRGATEGLIFTDLNFPDYDHPSIIRFILEPRTISITKKMGDEPATIIGSYAQAEKELWDKQKAPLKALEATSRGKQFDSVRAILVKMDIDYLVSHPQSYLSGFLLNRRHRWISVDSLMMLYAALSDSVRNSSLTHYTLQYIYPLTDDTAFRKKYPLIDDAFTAKLAGIRSIHDFSLKDTAGNMVNLSQFKGKNLLIDAWASWCKPCIGNIPTWNALVKHYDPKNIQFVTVSMDAEENNWKKAVRKHQPAGITLIDTTSFNGLFAVYCKVLWVARYLVVDPQGHILNYDANAGGEDEWKHLIDSYMKK